MIKCMGKSLIAQFWFLIAIYCIYKQRLFEYNNINIYRYEYLINFKYRNRKWRFNLLY